MVRAQNGEALDLTQTGPSRHESGIPPEQAPPVDVKLLWIPGGLPWPAAVEAQRARAQTNGSSSGPPLSREELRAEAENKTLEAAGLNDRLCGFLFEDRRITTLGQLYQHADETLLGSSEGGVKNVGWKSLLEIYTVLRRHGFSIADERIERAREHSKEIDEKKNPARSSDENGTAASERNSSQTAG